MNKLTTSIVLLMALLYNFVESRISLYSMYPTDYYKKETPWFPLEYLYLTTVSILPYFQETDPRQKIYTQNTEIGRYDQQVSADDFEASLFEYLRPGELGLLNPSGLFYHFRFKNALHGLEEVKNQQLFDGQTEDFNCFGMTNNLQQTVAFIPCYSKASNSLRVFVYDMNSQEVESFNIQLEEEEITIGYNSLYDYNTNEKQVSFLVVQEDRLSEEDLEDVRMRTITFNIPTGKIKYELEDSLKTILELTSKKRFRYLSMLTVGPLKRMFLFFNEYSFLKFSELRIRIEQGELVPKMYFSIRISDIPSTGFADMCNGYTMTGFNPKTNRIIICTLQINFALGWTVGCTVNPYTFGINGKFIKFDGDQLNRYVIAKFKSATNGRVYTHIAPQLSHSRKATIYTSALAEASILSDFNDLVVRFSNKQIYWTLLTSPMMKITSPEGQTPPRSIRIGDASQGVTTASFNLKYHTSRNAYAEFITGRMELFLKNNKRNAYPMDFQSKEGVHTLVGNIHKVSTSVEPGCKIPIALISGAKVFGVEKASDDLIYSDNIAVEVKRLSMGDHNYCVEIKADGYLEFETGFQFFEWKSTRKIVYGQEKPKILTAGKVTRFELGIHDKHEGELIQANLIEVQVKRGDEIVVELLYYGRAYFGYGILTEAIDIPEEYKDKKWKFSEITNFGEEMGFVRCYENSCITYFASVFIRQFTVGQHRIIDSNSEGIISPFCPSMIRNSLGLEEERMYIYSDCGDGQRHLYITNFQDSRSPIKELMIPVIFLSSDLQITSGMGNTVLSLQGTNIAWITRFDSFLAMDSLHLEDFGVHILTEIKFMSPTKIIVVSETDDNTQILTLENQKNYFRSLVSGPTANSNWNLEKMLTFSNTFEGECSRFQVQLSHRNKIFMKDSILAICDSGTVSMATKWNQPIFQVSDVQGVTDQECNLTLTYDFGDATAEKEINFFFTYYDYPSIIKKKDVFRDRISIGTFNINNFYEFDEYTVGSQFVGLGKNRAVIEKRLDFPTIIQKISKTHDDSRNNSLINKYTSIRYKGVSAELLRMVEYEKINREMSLILYKGPAKSKVMNLTFAHAYTIYDIYENEIEENGIYFSELARPVTVWVEGISYYNYTINVLQFDRNAVMIKNHTIDSVLLKNIPKQITLFKTESFTYFFFKTTSRAFVMKMDPDMGEILELDPLLSIHTPGLVVTEFLRESGQVMAVAFKNKQDVLFLQFSEDELIFDEGERDVGTIPFFKTITCREPEGELLVEKYYGICFMTAENNYGYLFNITRRNETMGFVPFFHAAEATKGTLGLVHVEIRGDFLLRQGTFYYRKGEPWVSYSIWSLKEPVDNKYKQVFVAAPYKSSQDWPISVLHQENEAEEEYKLLAGFTTSPFVRIVVTPEVEDYTFELTNDRFYGIYRDEVAVEFMQFNGNSKQVPFDSMFYYSVLDDFLYEFIYGVSGIIVFVLYIIFWKWRKGRKKYNRRMNFLEYQKHVDELRERDQGRGDYQFANQNLLIGLDDETLHKIGEKDEFDESK